MLTAPKANQRIVQSVKRRGKINNKMFDTLLSKNPLILLICIYLQIEGALSQFTFSSNSATPDSKLMIHERMCQQYKSQVYEKVYTISGLVFGMPEIENRVDNCAPSSPFIVGGTAAKAKEFPHMARLGNKKDDEEKTNWFCGGTLISKSYVLTAAHCFNSDEVNRVRLGDLVFGSDNDDAQPIDFTVNDYFPHPNYSDPFDYNDIGLVELNGSVTFSEYVAPACLPSGNGDDFERFLAVGWGSTEFSAPGSDVLLKVTLDRFNSTNCGRFYKKSLSLPRGLVETQQVCAGSAERKDTCTGDSGGPLLQYSDVKCMFQVVGITSTGPGCGFSNVPGIYTRVYDYIDWIESIVWQN